MAEKRSKLVCWLWLMLRFSLCAWAGAAMLFVVSVVREVTTPFETLVKNQLVALRFPVFYLFGFTLVGVGLATSLLLTRCQSRRLRALRWIAGLCGASLALMLFDYLRVYRPLEEMVLSPKFVIPPEFFSIHQWSKWLNLITALLCLTAAGISVCDQPDEGVA